MEDSKKLRHYGKLPYIKYSSNRKRNWFWTKRDKMRGVDYKSQEKLVEELYEDAFDSEGEHKVHTWTCTGPTMTSFFMYIHVLIQKTYVYTTLFRCFVETRSEDTRV